MLFNMFPVSVHIFSSSQYSLSLNRLDSRRTIPYKYASSPARSYSFAAVVGILDWDGQRYRDMRTCHLYQTEKNQIQEAEEGPTVTDSLWYIPLMRREGGGITNIHTHTHTYTYR